MSINIYKDQMEYAELFGKPILHTTDDVPCETVPEEWHCYDLHGTSWNPHKPSAITGHAVWGRLGTVLSPAPLKRPSTEARQIKDTLILSRAMMDLSTFCRERGLICPSNPRKYILRPASREEAGLFYSRLEPEQAAGQGMVIGGMN